MIKEHKVELAEAEVSRAKAQLIETIGDLTDALNPQRIMSDLWETAKVKGADLAEDAVDAVKKRPVAVGGAMAALTMFLARQPIKDAASRLVDAMTSSKQPTKKEPKAKPATLSSEPEAGGLPAPRRRARAKAASATKPEKAQ
ncbi:DUF3618 domain-containing protein [Sphingomonas xanthus]|uniref:DUF3618 domain-containing protein n=1 Tax=Sphingomonas xanthus TaxID=2594473 RepID=UPI00164D230C|nr:DUF3618 domain-containing protein [Sphingomonas xanthus]